MIIRFSGPSHSNRIPSVILTHLQKAWLHTDIDVPSPPHLSLIAYQKKPSSNFTSTCPIGGKVSSRLTLPGSATFMIMRCSSSSSEEVAPAPTASVAPAVPTTTTSNRSTVMTSTVANVTTTTTDPATMNEIKKLHRSSKDLPKNINRLKENEEFCLVEKNCIKQESRQNTKTEYKYEITDNNGDVLLLVNQQYESFPPRFDLKIYDPHGKVLVIHKLLQNLSSHLLSMQIICPGGHYFGSIEEKVVVNEENPPLFELKDSNDDVQAVVLSDFSKTMYGFRRSVQILGPDKKTSVGKISKKWSGFTDTLQLSIAVPEDVLDAKFRTCLIGLGILLNNRYIR